SGSQASPTPSPSRSLWVGFATVGQLSEPVQKVLDTPGLQTPSRSESTCAREQPLLSTGAPAAVPGQASFESNTPSASLSATDTLFEAALGLSASSSAWMAKWRVPAGTENVICCCEPLAPGAGSPFICVACAKVREVMGEPE